ncbi:hypothetical protein D3C87_1902590 [compost metagenome]
MHGLCSHGFLLAPTPGPLGKAPNVVAAIEAATAVGRIRPRLDAATADIGVERLRLRTQQGQRFARGKPVHDIDPIGQD